ncbi:MAG: hypothetical protein M1423_08225, partial [Acidobacteria bacterium]|nr:hypothetical protein [Acidobacteriota bacterium]
MNRRHFLKQGTLYASAAGLGPMIAGAVVRGQNSGSPQQAIDLSDAVVVSRPGDLPFAEQTAATVLVEEMEKRTSIHLKTSTKWPAGKTVIAITL